MRKEIKILLIIIFMIVLNIIFTSSKSMATISGYTLQDNYIRDIQPNTLYTDFEKNVDSTSTYTIKENNNKISETDTIKTGQVLTEGNNTYTLVVAGDVNGDGKADIKDIIHVNKHRLNKTELTGAYFLAGDVNADGKVNITDIMQINKFRLGKIDILGFPVFKITLKLDYHAEETIYEKYNKGYYLDSDCTKEMTQKDNKVWLEDAGILGYSFAGFYTEETGGKQFVSPSGNITKEASNTYFTSPGIMYKHWEITLKGAESDASSTSNFLNTSITRDKINKISFATSIEGHTVDNTNCFDVSSLENSKKVLLWINRINEEGHYDIVIGQNGGVKANTYSYELFYNLQNLKEIDLTNFSISYAKRITNMFYNCKELTSIDVSNFDTSNVTNMSGMFGECGSLTSIDVSSFDTSNVTNMGGMFSGCSRLESIDVSNFDTGNVTDMSVMFNGCGSLTSIDVSNFDTSNVTGMRGMFYDCSSLTNIDVSRFDTSNVTSMSVMFYDCSSLTNIDVSSFDTSNVINMSSMFHDCSGLTSIDVSSFDTSKVTDISWMFAYCSSLTNIDVSNFDTSNVINMSFMFYYNPKLTTIYVSDTFVTTAVTNSENMFKFDTLLKGEQGTVYDINHIDHTYAHIDGGTSNPGYFTRK